MDLLQSALAYFAIVFGTGFILGLIRTLLLVPRLGNRLAELLEMPLMFGAIILAARWTNRHFPHGEALSLYLAMGLLALGFLLLAEVGLGVALRGLSPLEALTHRDPVSGTVYYALLVIYAAMPWLLAQLYFLEIAPY